MSATIDTGHAEELAKAKRDALFIRSMVTLVHFQFERHRTQENRERYVCAMAKMFAADARLEVLQGIR